jgi:hypothetical protein
MEQDALNAALEGALGDVQAASQTAATERDEQQGVLGQAGDVIKAAGGGVWKSIFETGDFLFGEPDEEEKTRFRRAIEDQNRQLAQESGWNAAATNITGFVTGMVGLGKVQAAAKLIPGVARIGAVTQTTRATRFATEGARAAAVGAVVFDPHEARLSDLLVQVPVLNNPVTQFLAADPTDSQAEGRLKSALESIGLDATLGIALLAATKALRAFRSGDTEAAGAASTEADAAMARYNAVVGRTRQAPIQGPPAPGAAAPAVTDQLRATFGQSPNAPRLQAAADQRLAQAGEQPLPIDDPAQQPMLPGLRDVNIDQAAGRVEGPPGVPPPARGRIGGRFVPQTERMQQTDLPREGGEAQLGLPLPPPGPREAAAQAANAARPLTPTPTAVRPAFGTRGVSPSAPPGAAPAPPVAAAPSGTPTSGTPTPGAASAAPPGPVTVVQGGAGGPAGKAPRPRPMAVDDADVDDIVRGTQRDADAISKYGTWQAAVDAGHRFGGIAHRGGIPYHKLSGDPGEAEAFVGRVADRLQAQMDEAKGGKALSDTRVARLVAQRVDLFNDDPATLMGHIQAAGKGASSMVANMEAAYLVGTRGLQDSFALSLRIQAGLLDEFGGDRALAGRTLKQMISFSAGALGAARSISSNSGRVLRRMRAEFRLTPEALARLNALDDEALTALIAGTGGNAKALVQAVNPSFISKLVDNANFLLVNNLLWGWKTHVVNLTTNAYMMAVRPAERAFGSLFQGSKGSAVRRAALREYRYMVAGLADSFKAALAAFRMGDSIMAPHQVELYRSAGLGASKAIPWKPVANWGDLASNVLAMANPRILIGFPTRALGMADEMTKQIRYRSMVLAEASIRGEDAGLRGKALRKYIDQQLGAAFDAEGRALDPRALQEAKVSTFSQELLPGTLGRTVQSALAAHPEGRLILPFIRTPTNVLRMGWKMTPGLNLLQREYRAQLMGRMGAEAQAQAIGQMSLGALFLGVAASQVAAGNFTGGGPADPALRRELIAQGWQPYSYVYDKEDGSKGYFPLGRFDPVGLPFGIIADMMDVMQHEDKFEDSQNVATALLISLQRQLNNKTYLLNLSLALDAFADADANASKFVGRMAANMIPFSSMLRQVSDDPYLRETRGLMDTMMANVPGLSETLPPRHDIWGDPVTVRKGLWSDDANDLVDREMIRTAEESGVGLERPAPTRNGADLRQITLEDGTNAYAKLEQLSGHPPGGRPLKEHVATIMRSEAYQAAPDGRSSERGTKLWMIAGVVERSRAAAFRSLMATSPTLRAAVQEADMKVRAAYAARQAGRDQPGGNTPAQNLDALGRTFGVDLQGLIGPQ